MSPQARATGITESQVERAIVEMAQFHGYMVFHPRPAQSGKGWRTPVAYDGKGYPDLTLVGRGRTIFIEVKIRGRARLSPEQVRWRDQIQGNGGEWYLLTDADWQAGEVEKILAPNGHPPA